MEKGFSSKSFLVASIVEAFLRASKDGERSFLFVSGRLMGSEERLWKAD